VKFHHVAIQVSDIKQSIAWYTERFADLSVEYSDETWAIMNICGVRLALVMPNQHPRHIAFQTEIKDIHEDFMNKKMKKHRDGTKSLYVSDPDGNIIEILSE
jgi:catechol 2,3-dioxygenase-like lactoylglutathione lyase family enzyme